MSENKSPFCTLTDNELAAKADRLIDELIKSGGKSFTMHVPARPNADPDLIFSELNNRFKKLVAEPKPAGAVWVKAALQWSKEAIEFANKEFDCPKHFVETWGNLYMNVLHGIDQALDEIGTAPNKDVIENEREHKKAKAWDDWKDSLVTHENVFVHYKTKDEHYTEDYTLEEFKKVLTEKSPVFIYCNEWSSKIPHFQITTRVMPATGFYYFCNAWADKTPVHTTIEEFYKKLQQPGLKYFSF